MKIQRQAFFVMSIGLLGIMIFIAGSATSQHVNNIFAYSLIVLTGVLLFGCFRTCFMMKEILSPIFFANAFSTFVFIARPVQIMLSANDISQVYVIGMYNKLGGGLTYNELPILQASFIGFLGILFLNLFYFGISIPLETSQLSLLHDLVPDNNKKGISGKQGISILMVMIPAILSMLSFIIKQVILKTSISMIDIIWLYILCALVIYLVVYFRKASFFVYFIIAVSATVLGIASKRMYVVNLIICLIVPLYYLGNDRKKTIRKVLLMVAFMFGLVLIYGSIRADRIGATQGTIVEQLLDEFCMYDMLLVSLSHCSQGLFHGYNFLTVFSIVLPGVNITSFDHELTNVVFNGAFNGGIPVTLYGSLYMNFSYLGLMIGSGILGVFLRKIRNKYTQIVSIHGVMLYAIFTTFAYDIIRVGDIGREVWTCIIMIAVAKIFLFVVPYDDIGEDYE